MGMTVLRAISAGPGVRPGRFDGRVHSVFVSAANVRLEDGQLIALLAASQANLPRGVRLDTPAGFSFEDHLRDGETAACRAGIIRFSGNALQIDLRGASLWQADLKTIRLARARLDAPGLQVALDEMRGHPGVLSGITGAAFDLGQDATPLVRAAREPVQALVSAARHLDMPGASAAAAKLIGLGPGLTPSGDDFLVGFMAGLWVSIGDDPNRRSFASDFGAEIARLTGRTNDISRGFLLDAAQGQASESIITLVRAVDDGSEAGIRQAARAALDQGSTSGADAVAGLLSALTTGD